MLVISNFTQSKELPGRTGVKNDNKSKRKNKFKIIGVKSKNRTTLETISKNFLQTNLMVIKKVKFKDPECFYGDLYNHHNHNNSYERQDSTQRFSFKNVNGNLDKPKMIKEIEKNINSIEKNNNRSPTRRVENLPTVNEKPKLPSLNLKIKIVNNQNNLNKQTNQSTTNLTNLPSYKAIGKKVEAISSPGKRLMVPNVNLKSNQNLQNKFNFVKYFFNFSLL